jgi:hypothetical protein
METVFCVIISFHNGHGMILAGTQFVFWVGVEQNMLSFAFQFRGIAVFLRSNM